MIIFWIILKYDITSEFKDTKPRNRADKELAETTLKRITVKYSSLSEKIILSVIGIKRSKLGLKEKRFVVA